MKAASNQFKQNINNTSIDEIINGFNGCQEFIKIHQNQFFALIDSQFDQSGDFLFNDGLLTYQKLPA